MMTRRPIAAVGRDLAAEGLLEPDQAAVWHERAAELLARATDPLRPEGRPLFAGIRSLGVPDDPLAAMWRLGDLLRDAAAVVFFRQDEARSLDLEHFEETEIFETIPHA